MNKKRKVLTVVALIAFAVVIALHYTSIKWYTGGTWTFANGPDRYDPWKNEHSIEIKDVRMPLFVLAVFYGGLLLLASDEKERKQ
jgi:ABC-type Fe3+-siderophore transport system permease subunit